MSDQAALRSLITGHWIAQAIRVAAELGLADLLAGGARSGDDLAEATGTHPQSQISSTEHSRPGAMARRASVVTRAVASIISARATYVAS